MTTLEKVCRAACEAEGFDPERYWRTYEKAVNGVLKALKEPSEEMVRVGLAEPDSGWTDVELKGRFTAMIRKAKEG